ncbi:hypothetical protein FSP39_005783 [Pinctada imbricata]|uniref:Uncharacterized protein n=1 Tax=Pinctada imbricata TaxID=66713 RepID=A0AA89BYT6_PINIB|nr:hypothetical protein FSP39_005783 [Pinctada imbricata]
MQLYISVLLFILVSNVCLSKSQNITVVKKLLDSIFLEYDRDLMPFYDRTIIPTYFVPLSIRELDEVSGTFTIIATISMRWEDPRIMWNPEKYNGTRDLKVKSSKIWYPDLYCINTADKLVALDESSFIAILHYSGSVDLPIGMILKSTCDVDMTYFPFDVQRCPIEITAWGLSPDIKLRVDSDAIIFNYFSESPRWDILSANATNIKKFEVDGIIRIEFTIRRKPGYFVLSNLIPIVLLMILNPLVFILPVESGERLSYAVTIFLSLAVFMTLVSDNMPKSANPISLLSFFLMAVMIFSTLQCIMVIVISSIYLKSALDKVPDWILYILRQKTCKRRTAAVEQDDSGMSDQEVHIQKTLDHTFTWKDLAMFFDRLSIIMSYCCYIVMFLAAVILYSSVH